MRVSKSTEDFSWHEYPTNYAQKSFSQVELCVANIFTSSQSSAVATRRLGALVRFLALESCIPSKVSSSGRTDCPTEVTDHSLDA